MNFPIAASTTLRVLIVEESEIIRTGLAETFGSSGCIDVVGSISDCRAAASLAAELQPDVLVLDIPRDDPVELLKTLQQASPNSGILIFTTCDSASSAEQLLKSGARGYLVKQASSSELIAAVKAIAAGRTIVSISEKSGPLREDYCQQPPSPPSWHLRQNLSERECDVLSRIARGMTNQQIAEQLYLSVKTIETYRSRLTKKIGAKNRAELFEFAKEAGMLATPSSALTG